MAKVYDPILCMMVEEKVDTKDSTLGSVEEYYNKMVGKSKSEVEKIVASAKGNPNANLAYKKWKSTSTKDSLADLHGAIPVGKGYVKVRGYDFAVYNAKGELKGTYASPDEAEEAARNLDERPKGMKDASPIPVVKVIETKGKYSIIQDDRGLYWVTVDKTGHGGGTAEVNLSNARRTLEHYILMDKLEAKYGKKEGYKRYLAGETDECPEGMTCDALQFKPNAKYWSDAHHRYLLFKGYNDATKKYHFEDFGDDKFYFTEEEAKRLKVKDSVSSIDEAIRMCDKDVVSE